MKNNFIFILMIVTSSVVFAESSVVDEMKKSCKKTELCAVGEGDTLAIAKKNARVELSKIFNIKISNKFKSNLQSSGNTTEESLSEDLEESTDSALIGIEVKKSIETKTGFYALVGLNKKTTASSFLRQINAIDDQMKAIKNDGDSVGKVQLEKLYIKRENLHDQYNFLSGQKIQAPFTYEEIFSAKKEASKNVVVHIYLDEDEPKFVEGLLQKVVSDLGYKTTSGQLRNKNSTHVVTGEFQADKEYLNVEGFEKYRFSLKVKAMKSGVNVESGHLNFETSETGRNFSQATERAVPKIQEYLKSNIENLNFN